MSCDREAGTLSRSSVSADVLRIHRNLIIIRSNESYRFSRVSRCTPRPVRWKHDRVNNRTREASRRYFVSAKLPKSPACAPAPVSVINSIKLTGSTRSRAWIIYDGDVVSPRPCQRSLGISFVSEIRKTVAP